MTANLLQAVEKQLAGIKLELEDVVAKRADESVAASQVQLQAKIDTLLQRIEGVEAAAKSASKLNLSGLEAGEEKGQFSMGRFLQGVMGWKRWDSMELGVEKETCDNMARQGAYDELPAVMRRELDSLSTKANVATDAAGHFLVPLEMQDGIIPELESKEIAAKLGANRLTGAVGDLAWNTDTGGIAAAYVDSEAAVASSTSDPTFGRIELSPHVMTAAVDLSWGMKNQTPAFLDGWIRERIARKIALLEDKMFFLGSGAAKEPIGIANMTGLTTATDFTSADYTGAGQTISGLLQDMVGAVEDADGTEDGENLGWFGVPSVFRKIRKVNDADDKPLFLPMNAGRFKNLLDIPIGKSTQITSGTTGDETFGIGDFSTAWIVQWGTLAFVATSEGRNNALKNQETVVGVYAHDIGFTQKQAWNLATSFDEA